MILVCTKIAEKMKMGGIEVNVGVWIFSVGNIQFRQVCVCRSPSDAETGCLRQQDFPLLINAGP